MAEVKPVRTKKIPNYPVKEMVFQNPMLLKIIPNRWKKNAMVLTALGLTASLAACGIPPKEELSKPIPPEAETKREIVDVPKGELMMSPLFIHGGGVGSFGCSSVLAPFIFSESEALEVIRSEALAYGNLELSEDDSFLINDIEHVNIDEKNVEIFGYYEEVEPQRTSDRMDLTSSDKKIAIEYVSHVDVKSLLLYEPSCATVQSYNYQNAAKDYSDALEKNKPSVVAGIFYEPYSYVDVSDELEKSMKSFSESNPRPGEQYEESKRAEWDAYFETVRTEEQTLQRKITEENLRAQVRDFIDWLKGQGVI